MLIPTFALGRAQVFSVRWHFNCHFVLWWLVWIWFLFVFPILLFFCWNSTFNKVIFIFIWFCLHILHFEWRKKTKNFEPWSIVQYCWVKCTQFVIWKFIGLTFRAQVLVEVLIILICFFLDADATFCSFNRIFLLNKLKKKKKPS